tara:strand:+ start:1751 stop:2074 length:324 start_codon:yes stop_codon:yes gene_type:complete
MTCFHFPITDASQRFPCKRFASRFTASLASKDFSENLLEKSEKDGSELDIAVVVEKMTIFKFVSIVSPNGTVIYSYETAEEFEPSRRKRRREIQWPLESSSMPPLGT